MYLPRDAATFTRGRTARALPWVIPPLLAILSAWASLTYREDTRQALLAGLAPLRALEGSIDLPPEGLRDAVAGIGGRGSTATGLWSLARFVGAVAVAIVLYGASIVAAIPGLNGLAVGLGTGLVIAPPIAAALRAPHPGGAARPAPARGSAAPASLAVLVAAALLTATRSAAIAVVFVAFAGPCLILAIVTTAELLRSARRRLRRQS